MRFPLIATGVAAFVAVPLVVVAAGPQMTSNQFLSEVRCAAYQEPADLGMTRVRLLAEARHQAPETVAQAASDVDAIRGGIANTEDGSIVRAERAAACAGAATADAGARGAA